MHLRDFVEVSSVKVSDYENIPVSVQGARFLSLWPWSSSTSNSGIQMFNIGQRYNYLGIKLSFDACVSVQNTT